jgi:hypothetical protein
MENCQLPESVPLGCAALEWLLPQAESRIVQASGKIQRLRAQPPQIRESNSRSVPHGVRFLVKVSIVFEVLKAQLQPKLNRAGAMRIQRVQE